MRGSARSQRDPNIQLKKLFDTFDVVSTDVIISPPEMRESDDEVDESDDDLVRTFWRKMMDRYGSEEDYNRTIVEGFKGPGDPEIIIVVNKLLTGFDAPRNTVLYIARRLKEHGLLQAIARVRGLSAAASVAHDQPEGARPGHALVAGDTRLWRTEPYFPLVLSSCHGLLNPASPRAHRPTSPDRHS